MSATTETAVLPAAPVALAEGDELSIRVGPLTRTDFIEIGLAALLVVGWPMSPTYPRRGRLGMATLPSHEPSGCPRSTTGVSLRKLTPSMTARAPADLAARPLNLELLRVAVAGEVAVEGVESLRETVGRREDECDERWRAGLLPAA